MTLAGWHQPEGRSGNRFCWTERVFTVAVPAGSSGFKLVAALPPYASAENRTLLEVTVEDRESIRVELSKPGTTEYSIPLPEPVTTLSVCRFELSRAFRPSEAGLGDDQRELGLAVRELLFERS